MGRRNSVKEKQEKRKDENKCRFDFIILQFYARRKFLLVYHEKKERATQKKDDYFTLILHNITLH